MTLNKVNRYCFHHVRQTQKPAQTPTQTLDICRVTTQQNNTTLKEQNTVCRHILQVKWSRASAVTSNCSATSEPFYQRKSKKKRKRGRKAKRGTAAAKVWLERKSHTGHECDFLYCQRSAALTHTDTEDRNHLNNVTCCFLQASEKHRNSFLLNWKGDTAEIFTCFRKHEWISD